MTNRSAATTTKEIYAFIAPDEALPVNDPRYVPLEEARGDTNVAALLAARIEAQQSAFATGASNEHARFLLTGHRGCGKSTELYRLKALLEGAGFAVVRFDAETELNLQTLEWWNVLLEMVWQLDEQLAQPPYNIQMPDSLRDDVAQWLARVVTTKTQRTEMEASLTADFEVGAAVSFFAKAKAAIRSLVKAGSSRAEEIKTEVERRPDALRDAVAKFVKEAQGKLRAQGNHGLVIIADGLEKIPSRPMGENLTSHNLLFLHNGNHLKAPPCHLVYTVPLTLLSSANLTTVFAESPVLMPMIHLRHRNGEQDARALRMMTKLVALRASPALFAPGVIKELAVASGGHIRDFLLLVREAATGFGERVTKRDASRAVRGLINFYDRLIEQKFVSVLDTVEANAILPRGEHDGELLNRLLVLEYHNDDIWHALHPCVKQAPSFVRSPRAPQTDATP